MNIGLTEDNQNYLENAISTYKEIIYSDFGASKIQIITAKAGLGISYLGINNKIYYEELQLVIKDLEDVTLEKDLMVQMCLGGYYEEEYFSNYEILDLEKALKYYEAALKIEENFHTKNIIENNLYIILQNKVSNFYLRYATHDLNDDNSMLYLKKSIKLYDNLINYYNPQENKEDYYRCLKEQGRCYYFLKDENENLRNAYLKKSYNNMKTVLYFDDKELDDLMLGYYIFVLNLNINAKDIKILFNRYNRLLKSSVLLYDINTITETKFNILCSAYFWHKMSNSKKYYHIAKQTLKEINEKYYASYNFAQQQLIDNINDSLEIYQ